MISELHRTAIALAREGIPVFPCLENAKAPHTEHGFKDATTDLAQINAWWEYNPKFNIGICPDAAGCAVVDVDDLAAVATLELDLGEPLPDTFTIRTPRGGLHYWFRGQLPSSAGRLTAHVDTRGVGGYVLYPPSVVDGKRYTIERDGDMAELPERVKLLATKKRHVEKAVTKSDVALDLPANVQRGWDIVRSWPAGDDPNAGDLTAYKHACVLREFSLSPDTVLEMLLSWNDSLDDPMTRERIEQKVESAFNNGENAPGVWGVKPPEELFGDFLKAVEHQPAPQSRFRVLSEQDQDNIPDPTWVLQDVLPANSTVMLFAPSQGWKTFLALDWALTIASGIDKWGTADKGSVVYIAAEGAVGIARSRRPAWRALHSVFEELPFYIVPTVPWLVKPEDVMDMCTQVKAIVGRPKLLVIDTLARSMVGLDENAAKDAGIAIEACEKIKRELGCTVLVLHHTKKDGNGYRGSGALLAGFDSVIEFEADKDTMIGNVWIRKHKDAEVPDHPYTVKAETLLGSLALRMAADSDIPPAERITVGEVGEILTRLNAIDEASAQPENIVAFQLSQLKMGWEPKKVARLFRNLAKSGRLNAYRTRTGLYFCPQTSSVEF